jgi:mannose-6-phosphate isomerase-like protein (cupin superfamily)
MYKNIMNIFLDIDNTICRVNEADGAPHKYERAVPIPDRIARANALYEEGNTITYWTARGKASGVDYSDLTRSQLAAWGCKYHALRFDKPSYDLYVDDKSQNTDAYFASAAAPAPAHVTTPCTTACTVPKGWGHERIIINTEQYCGKILHFHSGAQFSMHYHIRKTETWYVYSGKFEFRWIDTTSAETHSRTLTVGDVVTNAIGQPHQLVCIEEGDIFEVSTQHFDSDSYRVAKGDSQTRRDADTRLLVLIHLGIGDHILMAPAIAHLAKQVGTLCVPCKAQYTKTVRDLYEGIPNLRLVEIPVLPPSPTMEEDIFRELNTIVSTLSKEGPLKLMACGNYCPSANRHTDIFPVLFYKDLGLSYEDCVRTFGFPVAKHTMLRDVFKAIGIPYIFVHEVSSTKTRDISSKFLGDRSRIVLTPDRNLYPPTDPYYHIAQLAVRTDDRNMLDYIPLMEGADEIHCIDSCYFSLAMLLELPDVGDCVVYTRGPAEFPTRRPWTILSSD